MHRKAIVENNSRDPEASRACKRRWINPFEEVFDSVVGLLIPSNWTTAGISLQASPDGGTAWREVFNSAGAPCAIGSVTGGTLSYYVAVDPTILRGAQALKVRSGSQVTPVVQANLVTPRQVTRLPF